MLGLPRAAIRSYSERLPVDWWFIFISSYLVVCWTVWFFLARASLRAVNKDADEPRRKAARRQLLVYSVDLAGNYPFLDGVSLLITTFICGPFMPYFVLRELWSTIRARRAWRKLQRTFREALVVPISSGHVPQAGQDYFDRRSPELASLGFQPTGTYLYKPKPLASYLRCFLSQAGETVADLALIGDNLAFSFTSILENGQVLETSCSNGTLDADLAAAINRSGRYTVQDSDAQFETADIATVFRKHLEKLCALEKAFACGTLHVSAEEVPVVKRYENAAFGEILYALKKFDNQPRTPDRPIGICKWVSHRADDGWIALPSGSDNMFQWSQTASALS
jgi:hypothetical protein